MLLAPMPAPLPMPPMRPRVGFSRTTTLFNEPSLCEMSVSDLRDDVSVEAISVRDLEDARTKGHTTQSYNTFGMNSSQIWPFA